MRVSSDRLLGSPSWHTGCAFERKEFKGTVEIVQIALIEKTIEHFDVTSGRSIPANHFVKLRPKSDEEPGGNWPYRHAVGWLMWFANFNQRDITNAVQDVSRHTHSTSIQHWEAVRYIRCYPRDTKTLGLAFDKESRGLKLVVCLDSKYTRDESDRCAVVPLYLGIVECKIASLFRQLRLGTLC